MTTFEHPPTVSIQHSINHLLFCL